MWNDDLLGVNKINRVLLLDGGGGGGRSGLRSDRRTPLSSACVCYKEVYVSNR